jgi:hydrogenase expression/formation protein HypC
MCLAIPALVKSIEGQEADVEVGGVSRRASIVLTPEARVGDYVLLHTGYAINVIDEEEAQETLKLFEEIARAEDDEQRDNVPELGK